MVKYKCNKCCSSVQTRGKAAVAVDPVSLKIKPLICPICGVGILEEYKGKTKVNSMEFIAQEFYNSFSPEEQKICQMSIQKGSFPDEYLIVFDLKKTLEKDKKYMHSNEINGSYLTKIYPVLQKLEGFWLKHKTGSSDISHRFSAHGPLRLWKWGELGKIKSYETYLEIPNYVSFQYTKNRLSLNFNRAQICYYFLRTQKNIDLLNKLEIKPLYSRYYNEIDHQYKGYKDLFEKYQECRKLLIKLGFDKDEEKKEEVITCDD